MAATACLPRGFFSKYLSTRNCFAINARSYARFAHRSPVRVLTSEEATKFNKRTLTFEEEQPTPTNVKPFAKKKFPKTEEIKQDFSKKVSSLKKSAFAGQEKLRGSNDSSPSSHGTKEVKEPHSTRKDKSKTKQVTFVQLPNNDTGNIQLEVFTDKQTAERKLA